MRRQNSQARISRAKIRKRQSLYGKQSPEIRRLLYNVSKGMHGDPNQAEDDAQVALLRVWKQLPYVRNLDSETALIKYSVVTVKNVVFDELRRRKRLSVIDDLRLQSDSTSDAGIAGIDVAKLVDSLKGRERDVLDGFRRGLTPDEIAQELDLGASAVAVYKSRALAKLRKLIFRKVRKPPAGARTAYSESQRPAAKKKDPAPEQGPIGPAMRPRARRPRGGAPRSGSKVE
jgi:RNA polymerase sigma factor (sigma-70 family)